MSRLFDRRLSPPRKSFFLLGARGTGKSTWVRSHFPEATRFDLLDERLYQGLLADIGRFAAELAAVPRGSWVVVDEVQRLPELLNEVHRFIEERKLKFVLTGSSARKLTRGGVNLLAGRAYRHTMHPFLPSELGDAFSLSEVLENGCIPIVWDDPERPETLAAYVETYIKEEIKAEALVRNLPGFVRFLPVAAACHARVLSISSVAREAEVSRTTVDGFFGIVEDTLLGFRLPAYESSIRVRERRHPKFYLIDPGLARVMRRVSGPIEPELRGALFEGFLAQVLRAHQDYDGLYDEIAYWSPAEARHTEVDFVLTRGKEIIAIEAKPSARVEKRDLSGLRAIAEMPRVKRRILVYAGSSRRVMDGVEVLPLGAFLELLDQREL